MPYVPIQTYRKLLERERKLRQRLKALGREATTDALTGLYRRPVLERALERECVRQTRASASKHCVNPIALLFADIDRFKRINDRFGHSVGDRVLAEVAHVIQRRLRPYDLAVRWGGEEIVVLLPATNAERAIIVANRILREVEAIRLEDNGTRVPVTISIGIADTRENARDPADLIRRADAALYRAKRGGRNTIRLAAPI